MYRKHGTNTIFRGCALEFLERRDIKHKLLKLFLLLNMNSLSGEAKKYVHPVESGYVILCKSGENIQKFRNRSLNFHYTYVGFLSILTAQSFKILMGFLFPTLHTARNYSKFAALLILARLDTYTDFRQAGIE